MLILQAALAAILTIRGAGIKPPAIRLAVSAAKNAELARIIRSDLESIAGTGNVNVSFDNDGRFTVKIVMQGFNSKALTQIYDRESGLRQLFPDLNVDFYFDAPELARAIKTDIESISGAGTVDVSIDSRTLFNVRVAMRGFNSELYRRIYDRALDFYRAFPDLSFDFYLRETGPAD